MDEKDHRVNVIDIDKLLREQRLKKERGLPKPIEITTDSERVSSAITEHRKNKGKIIFEVGCGGLFCINLGNNDLALGVDPMDTNTNKVSAKGLETGKGGERILFNDYARELPKGVYPDFVVMMAPSPESYEEILEELTEKTGQNTKFIFFIENQSTQAVDDNMSKEMVKTIKSKLMVGRSYSEPGDLTSEFNDYLEAIGLSHGGEPNTHPWLPEGEWRVVIGKGLRK